MTRTGAAIVVIGMMLFASSGCGTCANVQGQEIWLIGPPPTRATTPFGGIGADLALMDRGGTFFGLVDMPFSLVGDVVTLPWATYHWLNAVPPPTESDETAP